MHIKNTIDTLQQFPLFVGLTKVELEWLSSIVERRMAPKHSYIYLSDEPSSNLFLLANGAVKIGIYSNDGREIIKNIQHPNTIFGELGLAGEQRRTEFACAMSRDVDYFILPVDEFKKMMNRSLPLAQAVIWALGERVRKAERHWESLILKDVRSRIVEFLKESAGERGRQVGFETLLKHGLTQQDIANLVGASRQTVTAILNELKKSNLIHFNRNSILIRDMEKLN